MVFSLALFCWIQNFTRERHEVKLFQYVKLTMLAESGTGDLGRFSSFCKRLTIHGIKKAAAGKPDRSFVSRHALRVNQ